MQARRLRPFILVFAVTAIYVVAQAQTPLQFVPVVPCRVADTRNAPGHGWPRRTMPVISTLNSVDGRTSQCRHRSRWTRRSH